MKKKRNEKKKFISSSKEELKQKFGISIRRESENVFNYVRWIRDSFFNDYMFVREYIVLHPLPYDLIND